MPQIETQFEELPKFDDLEVKTKLTITNVVMGETPKNKYPCATLTTAEHGEIFATEKGVLYQLDQVKGKITEKDPLVVVVTEYTDKKGKTRKSIRNSS